MHYEDLILKELKNSGENWIAKFDSVRGGSFNFLIADSKVTDELKITLCDKEFQFWMLLSTGDESVHLAGNIAVAYLYT